MSAANAHLRSQRFVVTGASGFVGRHLLDRLVREGAEVVALSRRGTGRGDVTDVRVHDYLDAEILASHISAGAFVIHLAARAHQVGESVPNKALFHEANVMAAQAVARACRGAGARRLVFLSSIGVNGEATHGTPFTEQQPPAPVAPYAVSKWHGEQAVSQTLAEGPSDFVILRPPLIYGPGAPGNFEQLLKLVANAPIIPLGGIGSRRSFVGVHNLVDAMVLAAAHPAVSRQTFVVADSLALSLADTVRILAAGIGRSPHAVVRVPTTLLGWAARMANRQKDFQKLTAELEVNNARFRRATGWFPRVEPALGLREMAQAYREAQ